MEIARPIHPQFRRRGGQPGLDALKAERNAAGVPARLDAPRGSGLLREACPVGRSQGKPQSAFRISTGHISQVSAVPADGRCTPTCRSERALSSGELSALASQTEFKLGRGMIAIGPRTAWAVDYSFGTPTLSQKTRPTSRKVGAPDSHHRSIQTTNKVYVHDQAAAQMTGC